MTQTVMVALVPVEAGSSLPDPWVWWDGHGDVPPPEPLHSTWVEPDNEWGFDSGRVRWCRRPRSIAELRDDAAPHQRVHWRAARNRDDVFLAKTGQATFYITIDHSTGRVVNGAEYTEWANEPGDPDHHGRVWQRRVERLHARLALATLCGDGQWHLTDRVAHLVYDPAGARSGWLDPARRIARAPAGAPLPAGWSELIRPEQPTGSDQAMMWHAPPHLTAAGAWRTWDRAQATEMTIVVVQPESDDRGRWEAWRGIGGHAVSVGRHPTPGQAQEAAVALVEADRRRLDWVVGVLGPWPEVRVVSAASPGHQAAAQAAALAAGRSG